MINCSGKPIRTGRNLLRETIRHRVNDGGILRFIGKWLNAGVSEGGDIIYPEKGTPQGNGIRLRFKAIRLRNYSGTVIGSGAKIFFFFFSLLMDTIWIQVSWISEHTNDPVFLFDFDQ